MEDVSDQLAAIVNKAIRGKVDVEKLNKKSGRSSDDQVTCQIDRYQELILSLGVSCQFEGRE